MQQPLNNEDIILKSQIAFDKIVDLLESDNIPSIEAVVEFQNDYKPFDGATSHQKEILVPQVNKSTSDAQKPFDKIMNIIGTSLGKQVTNKHFANVQNIQEAQIVLLNIVKNYQVYDFAIVQKASETFDKITEVLEGIDNQQLIQYVKQHQQLQQQLEKEIINYNIEEIKELCPIVKPKIEEQPKPKPAPQQIVEPVKKQFVPAQQIQDILSKNLKSGQLKHLQSPANIQEIQTTLLKMSMLFDQEAADAFDQIADYLEKPNNPIEEVIIQQKIFTAPAPLPRAELEKQIEEIEKMQPAVDAKLIPDSQKPFMAVVEIVENIVGKIFYKKLFKDVKSIQEMQIELLFVQKKYQIYDEAVVIKCAEAFDKVVEHLEKTDIDVLKSVQQHFKFEEIESHGHVILKEAKPLLVIESESGKIKKVREIIAEFLDKKFTEQCKNIQEMQIVLLKMISIDQNLQATEAFDKVVDYLDGEEKSIELLKQSGFQKAEKIIKPLTQTQLQLLNLKQIKTDTENGLQRAENAILKKCREITAKLIEIERKQNQIDEFKNQEIKLFRKEVEQQKAESWKMATLLNELQSAAKSSKKK